MGIQVIEETNYGIYVWSLPDGSWFTDGEGNIFSIDARRGDQSKISALAKGAAYYGQPEGFPIFLSGNRKITQDEYELQMQRAMWGLTPDPLDVGAYMDEMKAAKAGYDFS